jgi:hypothetical protein
MELLDQLELKELRVFKGNLDQPVLKGNLDPTV